MEPPLASLPPGQLPKAGIKRRLTVPWGYEPLPSTDAQLNLCWRKEPNAVCVQGVSDVSTLPAKEMDALKRVWAEIRTAGGSACVPHKRGRSVFCAGCAGDVPFDIKRRRGVTHALRDWQWAELTGAPVAFRSRRVSLSTSVRMVRKTSAPRRKPAGPVFARASKARRLSARPVCAFEKKLLRVTKKTRAGKARLHDLLAKLYGPLCEVACDDA